MNTIPVNVPELVKSHDQLLHAIVSILGKVGGTVTLTEPDLMVSPQGFSLEMESGEEGLVCRIVTKEGVEWNGALN